MKRPIPWGRGIATVLAVAALCIAVPFTRQWWRMRTECADAQATVLAVLPDALGTAETVEANFAPKYSFTCKEMLVVEHDLTNESGDDATALIEGLRAKLIIVDREGKAVLEDELTDVSFRPIWTEPGTESVAPAFHFRPVAPGEYRLRIAVEKPAEPLVGVPHRVVALYELCGIEHLAAAFSGGIGLTAALVCLSLTTGVIVVTRKQNK